MAGKLVEIRLPRTFMAVAQESSFQAAALRLGITQATVSLRVIELEDRLGARLFERSSKSWQTQLTPAGHELLPDAEAMLALHDRILRRTRTGASGIGNGDRKRNTGPQPS